VPGGPLAEARARPDVVLTSHRVPPRQKVDYITGFSGLDLLNLDLDVDASRQVEPLQRVDRLRAVLDDVD
jgi:hypothetical protein